MAVIKNGALGEKTSNVWGRGSLVASFIFPVLAIGLALVIGGVLGTLDSSAGVLLAGAFYWCSFLRFGSMD